jgi:ferrochelatase
MIEGSKKGIFLIGEGAPKNADISSIKSFYNEYFTDSKVSVKDTWFKALKRNKLFLPQLVDKRKIDFEKISFQDGIATHIVSEQIRKDLEHEVSSPVFLANRYGEPSIQEVLNEVNEKGIGKLLIIPLFPNYLPMTFDTAILKVFEIAGNSFPEIELNLTGPYFEHKDYIKPLEIMIRDQNTMKEIEHLLFVYRGVKEEHIGDSPCKLEGFGNLTDEEKQVSYCYQVKSTTDMLMDRVADLNIDYSTSFIPSELGNGTYIEPNTANVLEGLVAIGKKNITIISPSTIVDNIETLNDIDLDLRGKFIAMGGESFTFIPSINNHPEWIEHLAKWADEWANS